VRYRLENQENPESRITLTTEAWFSILDLAEDCGWNPIGTMPVEYVNQAMVGLGGILYDRKDAWPRGYAPGDPSLVLLEDALNLADALELAFLEDRYLNDSGSPSPYYPSAYEKINGDGHAGVGVLLLLVDFCRMGPFWVESI
jgi:hypothetical protein